MNLDPSPVTGDPCVLLSTESPFALDDGLFFASEPSVAGDAAASLDASTAIGAADSSFSSGLGLDLGIRPNHSVHGRFSTHNTAYTTSTFDARPPPGPSLRRKKMDDLVTARQSARFDDAFGVGKGCTGALFFERACRSAWEARRGRPRARDRPRARFWPLSVRVHWIVAIKKSGVSCVRAPRGARDSDRDPADGFWFSSSEAPGGCSVRLTCVQPASGTCIAREARACGDLMTSSVSVVRAAVVSWERDSARRHGSSTLSALPPGRRNSAWDTADAGSIVARTSAVCRRRRRRF